MLSVLPAACEDASAWASCLSRKRPLPPTCLGEYHSAAGRAKRLRQELLRLREWEQQLQQEALGAHEGLGDSSDESFTVEPPHLVPFPQVYSNSGGMFHVEDASDSTRSSAHGLPSRVAASFVVSSPPPPPPADPLCLQPSIEPLLPQRRAASNPTDQQPSLTSTPVHIARAFSLPPALAFPHGSSAPVSTGCPATGQDTCDASSGGPPRWTIQPGSGSALAGPEPCCASVQLSCPVLAGVPDFEVRLCQKNSGRTPCGLFAHEVEENLLHEETSLEDSCGVPELPSHRSPVALGCCALSSASPFLLPPLPDRFLGMAMPLRLRLLEFFSEAAGVLGMDLQSLYLAVVFLDCSLVEEGWRKATELGEPSGAALGLAGAGLQVSALASLLHAFVHSSSLPRTPQTFQKLLVEASALSPRIAAMLPIKAGLLQQQLSMMQSLLPMAVGEGSISPSARVYGSMLELRGACSQKEHLSVFISQLCALGYANLPKRVVAAAACCLATGAVHLGHADRGPIQGSEGSRVDLHLLEHLQNFLCNGACKQAFMDGGINNSEPVSAGNCQNHSSGCCSIELSV